MRYLTGRPIQLTHEFLDDDDPMILTAVAVTVTPVGSDTASFTGAASETDDVWSVTVPALSKGVYDVEWNGDTDDVVDTSSFEVVGSVLFTIPEARAADADLADTAAFPAAKIRQYRDAVEVEFERITGRSFTARRGRFETLTLDQLAYLMSLDVTDVTAVQAITVDGETVDVDDWTFGPGGVLLASSAPVYGATVTVTVDYGFSVVPDDVKRAGIIRVRSLLAAESSGIPDRATSFTDVGDNRYNLATAGKFGSETGIPEVDAILARYTSSVAVA